jgi:hypothetical protein
MATKRKGAAPAFAALTVEGSLIAPAMLVKIANQGAEGQKEADYAVPPGLTLREEISRYFRIGQALFKAFRASEAPSEYATLKFIEALLTDVFGFADLTRVGQRELHGQNFALSLEALGGRVPIVVVPPSDPLDKASQHLAAEGRRRSAVSAIQDWLNASEGALWGLCTNGLTLRLVRDNESLTRPAYIEADLIRIFEDEAYANFALLWLLIHASRFGAPGTPATDCSLERWREAGAKEGVAAREKLRGGFEDALLALGNGFLSDEIVRERLVSGALPLTDYFGQLLHLAYRLIFLFVAEDRDLLHPPSAPATARRLYAEGYSVGSLRDRAIRRANWDAHQDRWQGLVIAFEALRRGEPRLGLPALGGLFGPLMMDDLMAASLPNRALMEAIFRLAWLRDGDALMPVNWHDMETEELGSVYEGLLELTPRLGPEGSSFSFAEEGTETKGNARKTSGSYYTPDSLVQALLDSALDPVLDRVEAETDNPAEALLTATVIDPACGSGHFLLGALRRIATRVARARAGGVASADEYRHALRDVARRCIHGVDRNPMAVELTKVALWIETVEPGKPLGFLDANIRCGDALLGVFDLDVLKQGIPNEAYKSLTGDDKDAAKVLIRDNRAQREREGDLAAGFTRADLTHDAEVVLAMPEDDLDGVERKRAAYHGWLKSKSARPAWVAADLYVAAFLRPKRFRPSEMVRGGIPDRVPTTVDVQATLAGRRPDPSLVAASIEVSQDVRALHWFLEFPRPLKKGGFDVVIGNPPYGAEMGQRERILANANFPITGSTGNTAADFIELARKLVRSHGKIGLIIPKSFTYSYDWRELRDHLLPHLDSISDVGQAWENVLLEQIILALDGRPDPKHAATSVRMAVNGSLGAFSSVSDKVVELTGSIPTGLESDDLRLLEYVARLRRPQLADCVRTSRGQPLQKATSDAGEIPVVAGKDIAEFQVADPTRFLAGNSPGIRITAEPTAVFQNIVAHVTRPAPHIRLIGAVAKPGLAALDTVNLLNPVPGLEPHAIAAYLMSNFVAWFVYSCIYNKAIRTMHFDNYFIGRIPAASEECFRHLDDVGRALERAPRDGTSWRQLNELVYGDFQLAEHFRTRLDLTHKPRWK